MHSSVLVTLFTWTSALVLWCGLMSTASAVTVDPPVESLVAEPGEAITLAFTVQGDGTAARVDPQVLLPPQWRLLVPESPFGVGPTDTLVKLLTVVVAINADVGSYDVRYVVDDGEAIAEVEVAGRDDIQLSIRGLPEAVVRGATIPVDIAAYNSGNTTISPVLEFRGSRGFAPMQALTIGPIAPGESLITTVQVVSRGATGETSLRVAARQDDAIIGRASTSSLTAMAQDEKRRDRVILPASVQAAAWMTHLRNETQVGPQLSAEAHGFLDPGNDHRLDVSLRGPDVLGLTAGGFLRSEYRGRYTYKDGNRGVDVRLGDERYNDTVFTVRTRRQRGVAVDVDLGRLTVGAMAVRDRFVDAPRTVIGPRASLELSKGLSVGASAVRQQQGDDVSFIASQFGQFDKSARDRRFLVRYEVAYGDGGAGHVDGSTRVGPVLISATARHAESSFTGEFAGQTLATARTTLRIGQKLTLSGNGSYRLDAGRDADPMPRDTTFRVAGATATWRPSTLLTTALSYQYRDLLDRLGPGFQRSQNTVTVSALTQGTAGRLQVSGIARFGEDEQYGSGNSQEVRMTASTTARRPVTLYTTTGYVIATGAQTLARERFYSSAGVRIISADDWQSDLSYGVNLFPQGFLPAQHQARAHLSWRLPWSHLINADANFSSGLNNVRASAIAGYEVPFGIPTTRTGIDGRVMGHVLRADDTPVVGAQMRFGNYIAQTDDTGRFLFNGLSHTVQPLDIVRSTLAAGEVVDGDLPQDVRPNKRSEQLEDIIIRVVSAGQVEAEVWRYSLSNPLQVRLAGAPPEYRRESPVVGAPLTLTNGDKTRFGLTNERGIVEVGQLPPGRWSAMLALPRNEPDVRIEQPRFMVMVDGGEMSSYTLRVVPDVLPLNLLVDSSITLRVGEQATPETPLTVPTTDEPTGDEPTSEELTTLVRLEIRPETLILDPSEEVQLRALAVYSDDTAQTLEDGVSWSSSNPGVARVNGDGLLTAQADGNTQVTAQVAQTTSAPVSVEVVDVPVVGLSLDTAEVLLSVGQRQTLGVQAVYVDGRIRAVSEGLQWTISDTQVARVTSSGELIGVASGTAQAWAEFAGVRTFPATVVVGSVSAVTLNLTNTQLRPGDAFRPVVNASLANGDKQDVTALVEWRVGNPDVLRQFGVEFVAQSPGNTTLTAVFNGRPSNGVQVTVQAPLGLLVEPEVDTIPVGKSTRFAARAIYPDGTTTTPERPTWSTSDSTRASVTTEGRVTAIRTGTVELVVEADGTSTRRSLRIVDGQRTMRPNVAQQRLEAGDNQLRVIGAYADGTEVDLTPWVQTWTSSNPEVVRVNSTGVATEVSNGQANITARLDGETVIFELDVRL